MSRFWKAFHKGHIGRLTDEELDSISRGLTPATMVYGRAKGPSWAAGRGRWIVPERGVTGMLTGRARRVVRFGRKFRPGYNRTGGFYGRFSKSGGELKFHDVDIDDGSIAQNGTVLNTGSINLIAQGTGESQRIGRKCTIRKIGWRYTLTLASTATPAGQESIRVILYLDKQANGVTATVSGAGGILAADNWQAFHNLANTSRFVTLMDRTHDLNPSGGAGNGTANDTINTVRSYRFFKNCNIPLEFSSTAGAITELRSNNIGVIVLAKNSNAVGSIDSKMRLRFSDS